MTRRRRHAVRGVLTVVAAVGSLGVAAPAAQAVQPEAHEVTVVAARWSGAPSPVSAADLTAPTGVLVNGAVSAAWEADTSGAVHFQAVIHEDWVEVGTPACSDGRVADVGRIWQEVATATGWVEVPRSHLVVVTPRVDCGGAEGVATQAGPGLDRSGLVWVNGIPMASVLAHELGHNLGLDHSNTLSCQVAGVRVTDAPAGSCTAHEYMDVTDVMGISHNAIGVMNPVHLARLGLLADASVIDITPDTVGEFTLPAYASPERRILRWRDGSETYYVIFRSATGRDTWLVDGDGFGDPGVAIYKSTGHTALDPAASYLLDAHVTSTDAELAQSRTVLDAGTSVRLGERLLVTTVGTDLQAARIWIGPRPTPPATPQVIAPPMTPPVLIVPPVLAVPPAPVTPPAAAPEAPDVAENAEPDPAPRESPPAPAEPEDAAGPADTRIVVDDAMADLVRYRGQWREREWGGADAGRVHVSRDAGSRVRVQVTGDQVRIYGARGQGFGRLVVRVDGITVTTLNLSSPRRATGAISSWIDLGGWGSHTVVLVTEGTGRVIFDGVEVR